MITRKFINESTLRFVSVGGKIKKVDCLHASKFSNSIDLELIELCDLQNQLTRCVYSTVTTENQRKQIE
jgi:hypothetical protein